MDELSSSDRALMDEAIAATGSAYAPYSNFKVGAAVRLDNGTIVRGSNQENVAYPSGLCAERTALFAASAQHSGHAVEALAIVARNPQEALVGAMPCGACRQVMAEFCGSDFLVITSDGKEEKVRTLGEIFPESFSGKNLI